MGMEQEGMQFLGIFGVYREAYKIMIFSWIIHNEIVLDESKARTAKYNKLTDVLTSEWITFWLFKTAYFTFLLIFSLLSTSNVVYTIACIYTGLEVTFKKVMSVVPKVWKRLMVTFIAFFVYNIMAFLIVIICLVVSTLHAPLPPLHTPIPHMVIPDQALSMLSHLLASSSSVLDD
ncbi:hypothetical protein F2P56_032463 [Juglans regia]|uniref:Uncharacterized protein n=1 Tax=Juglans regia TaxID=51240 RepID=A0A833SST4_JUGRE|nr:hypothetical protein F2P56_032463 [Juglans regia]